MPPTDARRREAIYQRWCANITRETHDHSSLAWASARALHDPEVQADPMLQGMIHGFVAEREAELCFDERDPAKPITDDAIPATEPVEPTAPPGNAQIRTAFARLLHAFEDCVVQFDEPAARSALTELESTHERYTGSIDGSEIDRCHAQLRRMVKQREVFEASLQQVAQKAISAARRGDHASAAGALRRLSSIHAARPMLLPDEQFARIRREITHGGEEHEHREAARALVARERAVASQIKKLADVVHEFHLIARRVAHDSETYHRAERKYQAAVREVRSHDSEWLAGLILELDTFLDEIHDESGRAETQVDRFLSSVRRAHQGLRREVQDIAAERTESK